MWWMAVVWAADGGAVSRVVVDSEVAVACEVAGAGTSGDACGAGTTAVGVAPLVAGQVKLPVGAVTWRPRDVAEMCDHQLRVASFAGQPVDLGRTVTPLGLTNATYVKLLAEVTGRPAAPVTQLAKVDLEGDGKDEVIFAVDTGDAVVERNGDHFSGAWVGVRRIGADGQVKTHLLFQSAVTYKAAEVASGERLPTHYFAKVLGLTDVDGDKKLEVVVQDGFYEGATTTVWRVTDSGPVKVGATGCGN